jgi:DNA-binding PucR family transcriptional regulator
VLVSTSAGAVVGVVSGPLDEELHLEPISAATTGIGRRHTGARGAAQSHQEAREAGDVGRLAGIPLARFDEIWLDRLLSGSLSPEALAAELLAPLEDLAEGKRDEWEETLAVYLEQDRSVTATARRLHLHPQTVRYRLGKLSGLFGELLESSDHRLALQIALRTRRTRRRPGAG